MLALLFLCCVGAAGANASAPTPQKAPSGQPSPDPAPQAETKPHTSTPSTPAISRHVAVSSARTESAPVTPRAVVRTTTVTTVAPASDSPATPPARHATTQRHAAVHRATPTRHPESQTTSLAFPFTLPRDLLLLPHAGTDSRGGGVLLLLSAAAMGVLALASVSLLRRLRRLELR